MRTFAQRRSIEYFHVHPWHGLFSLIASVALAGLVVMILVESMK